MKLSRYEYIFKKKIKWMYKYHADEISTIERFYTYGAGNLYCAERNLHPQAENVQLYRIMRDPDELKYLKSDNHNNEIHNQFLDWGRKRKKQVENLKIKLHDYRRYAAYLLFIEHNRIEVETLKQSWHYKNGEKNIAIELHIQNYIRKQAQVKYIKEKAIERKKENMFFAVMKLAGC